MNFTKSGKIKVLKSAIDLIEYLHDDLENCPSDVVEDLYLLLADIANSDDE